MIRLAFSVSLAVCFVSVPARADPPVAQPGLPVAQPGLAARLAYILGPGAETCPDEQSLRHYVAAQNSGEDPFTPDAPSRLTVTIIGRGFEFFGHIALDDGTGKVPLVRSYPGGPTCLSLVQDLAFSIRVILRPFVLPSVGASSPPSPPSPPLPPPTARPVAPTPPVTLTRPTALRGEPQTAGPTQKPRPEIGVGTLAAFGSAPEIAAGFGGLLRLRWPAWSLGLEGRGELATPADAEDRDGAVAATLVAGSAATCLHYQGFIGCHLATFGSVRSHVTNRVPGGPEDENAPYVANGLRLGYEVPLFSHIAAELVGDVVYNVVRPAVRVDSASKWTVKDVSGSLGVRVVASFF